MNEDRVEFTVLGRLLGTGTGWDDIGTNRMLLYDFESAKEYALPNGNLIIDFEDGSFEYYDEDGDILASFDILDIMKVIPAASTAS